MEKTTKAIKLSFKYLKIQQWAKEDRPREKLINKGKHALSNAELLAILLGSGLQNMTAVDLAQHILKEHNYSLDTLAKRSIEDLKKFKGIGTAKAAIIAGTMELMNRRNQNSPYSSPKINNSDKAYEAIKGELIGKLTEEFWVLLLNGDARLIKKCQISKGGLAKTSVDPRCVFKSALDHNASSIVLVHNHPSGNPDPSEADIELTEVLVRGSKLLDIKIADHIVFTDNTFFSFLDNNLVIRN